MLKRFQASVGVGGRNTPADVMTAQYLLNCVPASHGGPSTELVIDGISGPKTIGAIRKFQHAVLGRADGRIDPGGGTIGALFPYDPTPNQPVMREGVKMPASKGAFAKYPSYPAAYKSAAGAVGKDLAAKHAGGPGAAAKQAWVETAGKQAWATGAAAKQAWGPGAAGKLAGKGGVGGKSGY